MKNREEKIIMAEEEDQAVTKQKKKAYQTAETGRTKKEQSLKVFSFVMKKM